ncbi:MAG: HindVP family restriction endonuclease [Gammaproteobacteria bacterium]|nr:HindVP family restriction endonuclease [Gammaproteobacteria bacterium]
MKTASCKGAACCLQKNQFMENSPEIMQHQSILLGALAAVLDLSKETQSPFLVQSICRTEGQSLKLKDQCFDVFVWSDLAVMAIPLQKYLKPPESGVTRWLREIASHVRSLYDILQTSDFDFNGIYKGKPHGGQTDKSFALPGRKCRETCV